MAKRFILAGIILATISIVLLCLLYAPRQELARTANPDGTSTVIIGQERVFGVFGIEIVFERYDAAGKLSSASVKNQCRSWREARQKYAATPP